MKKMKLVLASKHCLAMAVLPLLLMFPLVSPLNDEGTALHLCAFSLCLLSVFEILQPLFHILLHEGSLKMVILAVKWIEVSVSFCACD